MTIIVINGERYEAADTVTASTELLEKVYDEARLQGRVDAGVRAIAMAIS